VTKGNSDISSEMHLLTGWDQQYNIPTWNYEAERDCGTRRLLREAQTFVKHSVKSIICYGSSGWLT
jgi:predicted FMN-binding regulatory protein PaiB